MSKAVKVAGNPAIDPTLPKVEITLGDKSYFLCFPFKALALAESMLRAQGLKANLYQSFDLANLDATGLANLLYAGLITHEPEMTIDQVHALLTLKNMFMVPKKIMEAFEASLAEPSTDDAKGNPTQPE